MLRWQVAYLAGCLGLAAGALMYVLCDFGGWPLLMYEPYGGEWLIANEPPSASVMVYPGMLLWGATGVIGGAALAVSIAPKLRWSPGEAALNLVGAWALCSVAFAAMYYLWGLWPF